MTKHDWFWLAVKVSGLVLILWSAVNLVAVPLAALQFEQLRWDWGSFFWSVVLFGAIAAAGVWLIRDGSLLLRWAESAGDRRQRSQRP